jgi:hypothetical protein
VEKVRYPRGGRRSGTHDVGEEVRYHKAGEGVRLYLFAEEQVDSTRNASEDKEALIRLGKGQRTQEAGVWRSNVTH